MSMQKGLSMCVGLPAESYQTSRLLLSLRCTSATGLIQVRGAKRRFDGNAADPYNYLKRKLEHARQNQFRRVPVMSDERMKKKLDLPYYITSLSTRRGGGGVVNHIIVLFYF